MESKTNGQPDEQVQPTKTLHAKSGDKKPREATREADAQVKRNQDALGVGKDHRTADMIRKGRGTFP